MLGVRHWRGTGAELGRHREVKRTGVPAEVVQPGPCVDVLLPTGEADQIVVTVCVDETPDDALHRREAGTDAWPEAFAGQAPDLVEQFLAFVVWCLQQPPPPQPLDHLDPVPPPVEPVAQRTRLGVGGHDVECLGEVGEVLAGFEALEPGVGSVVPAHVVVAHVVAQDRDRPCGEERGGDEHVVLEAPLLLGEAQVVVEQERRTEQLVRRQAVDQRRVCQGRLVIGLPEQLAGYTAALAGHLADDDVGVVPAGERVHTFQRLVAEEVVVVGEEDIFAAGAGQSDVARLAGPAGVLLVDDPQVRVFLGQRVQPGRTLVGRPVVDEDRLEVLGRHALPQQGADAVLEVGARVVDRDHDAHLHVRLVPDLLLCAHGVLCWRGSRSAARYALHSA